VAGGVLNPRTREEKMMDPIRVELVPRPGVPDEAATARIEAAKFNGSMTEIAAAEAAVRESATPVWVARTPGEFPVLDFAVQHDNGRAVVNLVVSADVLVIGEATPAPVADDPEPSEADVRRATLERLLLNAQDRITAQKMGLSRD
jgi:hypothetical protein